jgi:hypothetical protein
VIGAQITLLRFANGGAKRSVATISARSPEGIRAKARALKQPDVEFSDQYPAIAASLADDVLTATLAARPLEQ